MSTYNIHAGHSLVCRGAKSILDEVVENRIVKDKVIAYLRQLGHTVYDCTDDTGRTANENLSNIVKKCNAHNVDVDVSIHLNAGRTDQKGDGSTGGAEVFGYDNGLQGIGATISANIANALNIRNRGFKTNTGYYVLRKTTNPALIVECCFVDDKDDADRWNPEKCAVAIVEGLTGQKVSASSSSSAGSTSGDSLNVPFLVRVKIKDLNIRKGPGTNYGVNGVIEPGSYTITDVKSGTGSDAGWGKLKSGAGWVSLDFVERV